MSSVVVTGEKNIAFVHNPKVAGMSIKSWLISNRKNSTYQEFDLKVTFNDLKNTVDNLPFSFSIVRNPWDRMVSGYYELRRWYDNPGKASQDNLNFVRDYFNRSPFPSFDQFMNEFPQDEMWPVLYPTLSPYPATWPKGAVTQKQYVDGVDLVLRYENITEDFKQIQKIYDCDVPLPMINTSENNDYRSYYNDRTKAIGAAFFQEDIDTFRYSF